MKFPEERLIGISGDESSERVFVCVGGLHGNEPAGIHALERFFQTLAETGGVKQGLVLGLRGNMAALQAERRFLEFDLNRIWTEEAVREPRQSGTIEFAERRALEQILFPLAERQEFLLADLHTTSSESAPFIWNLRENCVIGRDAPVIWISDYIERIRGSMASFFSRRGFPVLSAEGGAHRSPLSAERLEDLLWLSLEAAQMIDGTHERVSLARKSLAKAIAATPKFLTIFYHHMIADVDRFRMRPGFSNLQWVAKGTVLADDRNGAITAPKDCYVLMPLYQKVGEDGFLLVEAESD